MGGLSSRERDCAPLIWHRTGSDTKLAQERVTKSREHSRLTEKRTVTRKR
jgi:hypothetical protein